MALQSFFQKVAEIKNGKKEHTTLIHQCTEAARRKYALKYINQKGLKFNIGSFPTTLIIRFDALGSISEPEIGKAGNVMEHLSLGTQIAGD